jgi:hypothetical protein
MGLNLGQTKTGLHADEPLILKLSPFEAETATEKLKICKSSGITLIKFWEG